MIIKILLIAAALGIAVFVVREKVPGRRQALRRAVGLLVVLIGIVAVLWPDLTIWAANIVGVKRGTDLVLYGLVVVFAYTSLATAQKIHLLEGDIRVLTRALALAEPLRPPSRPQVSETGLAAPRAPVGAQSSATRGRTPEGP